MDCFKCATLTVFFSIRNDDGTMVTRQYTPISRLNQRDYFEVVIKVCYQCGKKIIIYIVLISCTQMESCHNILVSGI